MKTFDALLNKLLLAGISISIVLCNTPLHGAASPRDRHQAGAKAVPPQVHPNAQLTGKDLDNRVENLLRSMTLSEKAGQLAQYTAGFATGPGTQRENYEVMIEKGEVGSLLNVNNAASANHYQHVAMEKSRLHIPLLFGLDVVHGDRTTFPVPLGMAASFDPPLVERTARVAAIESRNGGAPMGPSSAASTPARSSASGGSAVGSMTVVCASGSSTAMVPRP